MRYTTAPKINIDDIDFKLLENIASQPRMPTTELGQKLDVTAATIKKRMSRLQKLGIIKGFSMEIDLSKLGYQGCKLDIYLKNHKSKHQIANYIINSPYIRSHYITPIGYPADLEFEICFMNIHHVHKLMEDLNNTFSDSIKTYKYHTSLKRYKNRYMPKRIHG
jgi:DNA-binding Lrp family transcriptional regulator